MEPRPQRQNRGADRTGKPLRLSAFALLTLALGFGHAVDAQQAAEPDEPAQPEGASVELTSTPYALESLGISLRLPVGARVNASQLGTTESSLAIFAPDGAWRMLLRGSSSRDETLSASRAAAEVLEQLQQSRIVRHAQTNEHKGSAVQIIEPVAAMRVAGLPAARFYAAVPRLNDPVLVSGYTIIQSAPGRFIVAELDCLLADFDAARPVYERVLDTLTVRDQTEVDAERAALLMAGQSVLASLDRPALEALLPESAVWWRHHLPARDGQAQREVGYQRVEVRVGQRGELDPRKPRSRWGVEEREFGFVASVVGRFLDGERIVDSQSIFFLSFDRTREFWVIRMTIRQGESAANWTETGARQGEDIKVTADQPGATPILKHWKQPPRAYLSQVEVYLLPRILVDAGAEAMFGFYRYMSSRNDIALRRDTLRAVRENDAAPPGALWTLETRASEDAGASVMFLDSEGNTLLRRLPDGSVMTPISLSDLKQLWRRKGLPLS